MRQHSLLPGHHHLLADGLVFVDAEVENVNLQRRKERVTLKGFSTLNTGFSVFVSLVAQTNTWKTLNYSITMFQGAQIVVYVGNCSQLV